MRFGEQIAGYGSDQRACAEPGERPNHPLRHRDEKYDETAQHQRELSQSTKSERIQHRQLLVDQCPRT